MPRLALIKLGGGLITDKTKPLSPHLDVIKRLAKEIKTLVVANPELKIVAGTGAGSFGHFKAKSYDRGVEGPIAGKEDQVDEVHKSVEELSSLVKGALEAEGLKTRQFSAEQLLVNKELPETLLQPGEVALVYGDIIKTNGDYKVVSTEEIFLELLRKLKELFDGMDVVLVTAVGGVLDAESQILNEVNLDHDVEWSDQAGYDVTGGMKQKVEMALKMAEIADSVRIIGAKEPGNIIKAVQNKKIGTKVG